MSTTALMPSPLGVDKFYGNRSPVKTQQQHNSSRNTQSSIISYDEMDNRTSVLTPEIVSPISDNMCRESDRLKTFDSWPLNWLDKNVLASTGMFYTGIEDKVKCQFCKVEIGCWEPQDHPVQEHMHWSRACPLLRRCNTSNIPIDAEKLDRLLPTLSFDICGSANDFRTTHYASPLVDHSGNSNNSNSNSVGSSITSGSYTQFPEYAIEAARERSFAEWPRNMKQKPKVLAEAGFFYTGIGDRVKCFSCGGGLKDWDENDEPWEQHALWLSKCRYINLMRGQSFIDEVIAKHKVKKALMEKECQEKSAAEAAASMTSVTLAPVDTTIVAGTSEQSPSLPTQMRKDLITPAPIFFDNLSKANTTSCRATTSNNVTMPPTESLSVEKKSNSNVAEEKLCKICFENEYNTAFLPCGHVVACTKCASSVTKCPVCRKPFTDIMRVFFS